MAALRRNGHDPEKENSFNALHYKGFARLRDLIGGANNDEVTARQIDGVRKIVGLDARALMHGGEETPGLLRRQRDELAKMVERLNLAGETVGVLP